MKRRLCVSLLALSTAVIVSLPSNGDAGRFKLRASVTYVVDGDTLDVSLTTGRRERVRLIGIDTPERGECFGSSATARARRLALGKRAVLVGDATQDTRDRYGRLLAYVWLPRGKDLGYSLLVGGFAQVYVYERPFARLRVYRNGQAAARRSGRGAWRACRERTTPRPRPRPRGNCDAAYPDVCIPSPPPDLDCGDIPHRNFRVFPPDPHRFDGRDNDGRGCERP